MRTVSSPVPSRLNRRQIAASGYSFPLRDRASSRGGRKAGDTGRGLPSWGGDTFRNDNPYTVGWRFPVIRTLSKNDRCTRNPGWISNPTVCLDSGWMDGVSVRVRASDALQEGGTAVLLYVINSRVHTYTFATHTLGRSYIRFFQPQPRMNESRLTEVCWGRSVRLSSSQSVSRWLAGWCRHSQGPAQEWGVTHHP